MTLDTAPSFAARADGAGSAPPPLTAKVRRFPCSGCGADVTWSATVAAPKCPFCGVVQDRPQTAETVVERPIEEGLAQKKSVGWGIERKVFSCRTCGAKTSLPPAIAASKCAFCGAPSVVEAPPDETLVRPEGVVPFAVDRNTATAKFREWISGLWFRPNDLAKKSSVAELLGMYIPFWTFDAATDSAWTAEAGFYYSVQVEAIQNGQRVLREERRVRWEPASGFLEKFFDDLPVGASRGLDKGLAQEIEPFPTQNLTPYDAQYLSGFLAEEYAVELAEALKDAERRMREEIHAACSAAVPGDTQRGLAVRTAFSGIAYKSALFPLWIAAYQYGGKSYRFLVNGATGKVSGHAPFSWIKIGALVAVILAVLFALSR